MGVVCWLMADEVGVGVVGVVGVDDVWAFVGARGGVRGVMGSAPIPVPTPAPAPVPAPALEWVDNGSLEALAGTEVPAEGAGAPGAGPVAATTAAVVAAVVAALVMVAAVVVVVVAGCSNVSLDAAAVAPVAVVSKPVPVPAPAPAPT